MKKRNATKNNLELYLKLEEDSKFEDTRYYGLFEMGKDEKGRKKIRIDPRRFSKKVQNLTEEQLRIINKRRTHYFTPSKFKYDDYNCNIFVTEMNSIKKYWYEEFSPLIKNAVEMLEKPIELFPGDYYNLMCGISGSNGANAWANWENEKRKNIYRQKKFMTLCNLYAQFIHYLASRVEAITVFVLARNGKNVERFDRNALYDYTGMIGTARDLPHHKFHDKLYLIWHFIKHNSISTYEKLKKEYPEVLVDEQFQQGHLAISYVKFKEELIIELIDGCAEFFKEFCEWAYHENYDEAQWNYAEYFQTPVYNLIEDWINPLGLTVFDEMD